ncbi:YecA family protein [Cohnella sp. GCM10027633]|uniref:YecA family protein n=1 Tax=unclassified Cohnella TaxID=2636738 RepID=UPI00362A44EC
MLTLDDTRYIRQMNIEHAIKSEVRTKLSEVLPLLSKARLQEIAKHYAFPGRSKMSKEELISELLDYATDPLELEETLLLTDAGEWNVFRRLIDESYAQDDSLTPSSYLYLNGRGLLFSFYSEDNLFYVVPDEVKETYRRLPHSKFLALRDRVQLANQYVSAAANLYGVCSRETVAEIVRANEADPLSEDEWSDFYLSAANRAQQWYLHEGYVLSDYFDAEEQADEIERLLMTSRNKPYYIPSRTEFLKYANSDYYEATPQMSNLRAYILQNLSKDKAFVDVLMDDIQVVCSLEEPLQAILDEFERRELYFDSPAQARDIISLLTDVCNHTRIWSNRGHTPAELGLVSTQARTTGKKVGRNDPCPCGSGKKYKKCCGQ